MCGIAGFAGFRAPGLIERMCAAIVHRGPDGRGVCEDPVAAIAIGMQRLAIIDLTGGDQPFHSADRRVTLVYNGEIYNFRALRAELEETGHRFRTSCDTEVVLNAYLEWGRSAWQRLHGMFALALIDRREGAPRLILARDRPGMKPLYYAESGGRLVFASEIKSLLAWPDLDRDVDPGAISDYLALRYVPGPRSLFRAVRKLPPGHDLVFAEGVASLSRWWRPPPFSALDPAMDEDTAAATLGAALRQSVRSHMVADVPVGAFLSGGIDSTAIVALMAEASSGPVHTFSIGFPDFPDEDRQRAGALARHLGTDHMPIECRAEDMAALPDIAWSLDEPIGDAIVVPMWVLAREARRQVKVVLSGEGADEILGGYMFHRKLLQMERLRRLLPAAGWRLAASVVERVPAAWLDRLFDYPGALGTEGRRKIAALLAANGRDDLVTRYRAAVALFDREDRLALAAHPGMRAAAEAAIGPDPGLEAGGTAFQRLLAAQFHDWLPDDILMKADKMTMAHSLEGRIPFMDDAVIAAAARIPRRHHLRLGTSKWALRRFARSLLPAPFVDSPKQAFYLPLESYMQRPVLQDLLAWALDPARLRRRGLFHPEAVRAYSLAGEGAGFLPLKRLFSILMLELWFERFCPDASWA